MGVISLILGIIALLGSIFLVGAQWVGAMIGLVGMLCGALGRMNSKSRDIATAGLICSILAFVFGIVFYVSCILIKKEKNGNEKVSSDSDCYLYDAVLISVRHEMCKWLQERS